MKKVYNAPKAEKLVIEARDIITASRMLELHSSNDENHSITSIDWSSFSN